MEQVVFVLRGMWICYQQMDNAKSVIIHVIPAQGLQIHNVHPVIIVSEISLVTRVYVLLVDLIIVLT